MAIELLVVADDITGSLDTGVQFAVGGRRAFVTLGPPPLRTDVDVWIVDTESRHLRPAEAAKRVGDAVGASRALGARVIYKKTDSTLRGNIGAELEAALAASERAGLVFAPAYPALGRTTREGRQLVGGVPIDESAFGRDPLNPVRTACIARLIAEQSSIRTGLARDAAALRGAAAAGARIIIVDAERDEELLDLATKLWPERDQWVFAGSAGFAGALRRTMVPGTRATRRVPTHGATATQEISGGARVLIVCGSLNPVSLEQVETAERLGVPAVIAQLDGPATGVKARSRGAEEACRALVESGAVIVRSLAPGGKHRAGEEVRLSKLLAAFVRRIVEQARPDALAVFGGDTLIGIMTALEIGGLAPYAEITSGVPVSAPLAAIESDGSGVTDGSPRIIISKAGGFGEPDLISSILAYVRKQT